MNNKNPIVAKPSSFLLIGLPAIGVICIVLACVVYFFVNPAGDQQFATGLSLILGCVGTLAFYGITQIHTLILYTDRLVVKSIFGTVVKEIYLNEITSWMEVEYMRGKSVRRYNRLTIYTRSGDFKITSETYPNYSELKPRLVQGKGKNTDEEKKWHKRDNLKISVFTFIAAAVVFFQAFNTKGPEAMESSIGFVIGALIITGIGIYYLRKKV